MKIQEQQRAVELRKEGLTYSEILNYLKVSKSSLSKWLRQVPYQPREDVVAKRRLASIRNGRLLHERKIIRTNEIRSLAKREISECSFESLKMMGIMAYWCEGSKTQDSAVKFTNSDATLIRFMMKWLRVICKVPEHKFRIHLRVHPDVNHDEAREYWSKVTAVPLGQFFKVTVKVSDSGGKRPNQLPYGIVTINVCDTALLYKIRGWIDALVENILI